MNRQASPPHPINRFPAETTGSVEPAALLEHQRHHRNATPDAFSLSARRKRLTRLLKTVKMERRAIAQALREDLGRPEAETELAEIFPVLGEIRHALRHMRRWARSRRVAPSLAMLFTSGQIQWEPKGTVLVVSPWNYPFSLTIGPMVSAIAAGNSVIVKPSEQAPATAALVARIISALFAPEEVSCLIGDSAMARRLTQLPFDHVFFTGGTTVGREILRATAETMATVTLELGGKCPALVMSDSDLDDAARKIAWGRFLNAGQTCVAPDYVLVPKTLRPAFLHALTAAVTNMYGSQGKPPPDSTHIVNERHYRRLIQSMDRAKTAGDDVVLEGIRDPASLFIGPTIFEVSGPVSPLMEEEIFGPILPVVAYDRLEDAIKVIRERSAPLCIYAFTRRPDKARSLLFGLPAGATVINDTITQYSHPGLPFGGVGASGMGRAHGRHGFEAFSNLRASMVRSGFNPVRLMYPPYTERTTRLIRFVTRWL